ncbi:MAG TPA: chloride channel protein [Tepidisphaeraceae bacterium]|jgi:H+/Cl- antiporter ClcA|nr:chloride channel protein [Tepidisphaeraceae bacterium]
MAEHEKEIERATTTEGLPVSMSMGPAIEAAHVPRQSSLVSPRVLFISFLAIAVAMAAALIAQLLMRLISLVTHIAFYGQFATRLDEHSMPAGNHLGAWVIVVPVIGGLIVGVMARFGHKAIRGHGIPEAMEQVLLNQSRIPPRITFLKPLSAAVAIGTGGPFGAEGPIIATGGALGSLVGQIITTTAIERKTLLAAGAAAGMAATFGSPVSAVLLAIELLLFEYRARSLIPVALASVTAAGVRVFFDGVHPVFAMPDLVRPAGWALAIYIALGGVVGVISVGVTRAVYWVEDLFEHLPLHWMWWPAVGAVAVGVIGYFAPLTLGVGYSNISRLISFGAPGNETFTIKFIAILCLLKFVSWAVALGSGTSGGTLAPLFTIGGGAGALLGAGAARLFPGGGVDIRVAALVGMAAMFAGASRAMLASAVFAFETTLQPLGLLPLLGGCTAAFLASALLMRNTIMTEKIARRGVRVPAEYEADFLDGVLVADVCSKGSVSLRAHDTLAAVRQWISSGGGGASHQGFPVLNEAGHLQGVLTRRDLLNPQAPVDRKIGQMISRRPTVIYEDSTLREAADHMVRHDVGRLPVISRKEPWKVIGMVTRSDVLGAHRTRIKDLEPARARPWTMRKSRSVEKREVAAGRETRPASGAAKQEDAKREDAKTDER